MKSTGRRARYAWDLIRFFVFSSPLFNFSIYSLLFILMFEKRVGRSMKTAFFFFLITFVFLERVKRVGGIGGVYTKGQKEDHSVVEYGVILA